MVFTNLTQRSIYYHLCTQCLELLIIFNDTFA